VDNVAPLGVGDGAEDILVDSLRESPELDACLHVLPVHDGHEHPVGAEELLGHGLFALLPELGCELAHRALVAGLPEAPYRAALEAVVKDNLDEGVSAVGMGVRYDPQRRRLVLLAGKDVPLPVLARIVSLVQPLADLFF
jgi:hypothetical protein